LVPTRELAEQVLDQVKELTSYCHKDITCVNLAADIPTNAQKPLLAACPDVVVATPSRVLNHLELGNMAVRESLQSLVIDEADLVLSFGYEEDLRKLLTFLPSVYQSYLMSATLSQVRLF
jgi:ATP-dependent RNA helicase DDX56/DBP9